MPPSPAPLSSMISWTRSSPAPRGAWARGATKDQIADMLATAADEVESIDDFLRAELEMFETIDVDADK